jgi:ribosomal-protein-serine acetyltransferase
VLVTSSVIRLPERIEGHGLVIRRWRAGDAEVLAQAVADSVDHLRPWMEWIADEPVSLAERRARIERWEEEWARGGDAFLGVFEHGLVAGSSGLHRRIGPGGLEIGYWVHPAFTGRGLATAAAALLTSAGLAVPGIDRVEIHHDRANQASAAIPRKLGFTFVGEVPDEISAPGEVGVECVWRMEPEPWARRHSGPLDVLTSRRGGP